MSPLLAFATGWILVGASDVKKSEAYHSYENGVVTENTVFERHAFTAIHCAILCQQQDACEAFTFDGEVCRGQGFVRASSADDWSSTGTRIFMKESGGSCFNYAELDDYRRNVDFPHYTSCDSDIAAGWYRFLLYGNNAAMPTTCVEPPSCGTGTGTDAGATYWLDLQGGVLPAVGEKTAARACGSYGADCCNPAFPKPITVRNCGAFYVYNLEPENCDGRYCAEEVYNYVDNIDTANSWDMTNGGQGYYYQNE